MSFINIMLAVEEPQTIDTGLAGKVLRIASAFDARIELHHCLYDAAAARPSRSRAAGMARIRAAVELRHRQLESSAAMLRGLGLAVTTSVRWDYPPWEGIIRQVMRHRTDLLVVRSSRVGPVGRLFLTHTDFRLIEACPCPLLLIKTQRPYKDLSLIAAVDPLHPREGVVALDDAVLEAATALGSIPGAHLKVYHAAPPWEDVVRETAELRTAPEVVQPDIRSAYRESIAGRVRELARRHGVPAANIHIGEGRASEALPRFAHAEGADIVVLGAESRSMLKRIVIGHTAERVLDELDADVLVVKSRQFRSPVSRQSAHRVERLDVRSAI